jgi:hypothetical protein
MKKNNHSTKFPMPMSEHSTWKVCEHPYVDLAALHSQCVLQAVGTNIFIPHQVSPDSLNIIYTLW